MLDQFLEGKFPSNSTIDLIAIAEDIDSRDEIINKFYKDSKDNKLFSVATGTNFWNIRLIKYSQDNKLDNDYHFTYDIVNDNDDLNRKFKQ